MRILIADDHSLFRDGLRHVLSTLSKNLTVFEAGTLPEALALLDGAEPYDLIIIDLAMPGMDGPGSIADVRALAGPAPIVVISASEDLQDVRAALDSGASGYIPKSVRGQVLLSALQLVMVGSVFVRPQVLDVPLQSSMSRVDAATSARIRSLLTERQLDVLRLLAEGKPNKEIARQLNLSRRHRAGACQCRAESAVGTQSYRSRARGTQRRPVLTRSQVGYRRSRPSLASVARKQRSRGGTAATCRTATERPGIG